MGGFSIIIFLFTFIFGVLLLSRNTIRMQMNIKHKIVMTMIITMPVFSGCRVASGTDFIIIDKADKMIVVKSYKNNRIALHAIRFVNRADGAEYYNNIHVDDTLRMTHMFNKIIQRHCYGLYNVRSKILQINGQTLKQIKPQNQK